MQENSNLPIKIDIKVDSKDAVNVINKLINTIKYPFERWIKNSEAISIAKAETKATMIRAKAAKPLAEVLKVPEEEAISLVFRSEQRELYERLRQQKNIEMIINNASKYLPEQLPEDLVDEDWTLEFIDQCKNTSNKYLQSLWSRILAGEIGKPGKYSKRVLSFIKTVSQKDAQIFTKFCSLVFNEKSIGTFALNPSDKKSLEDFGVNYEDLIELDAYGLIRFDNEITGFTLGPKRVIGLCYFDDVLVLNTEVEVKGIRIPIIPVTKLGRDLLEISGAEKNEDYETKVKNWLNSIDGFHAQIIDSKIAQPIMKSIRIDSFLYPSPKGD